MNPYSHLVVACQVEDLLRPTDRADYLLGAVIPDVRYLLRWPRLRTHVPLQRAASCAAQHPRLRSFVLGYMLHCAVDELDLPELVLRRLPLRLLRGRRPRHLAPVLLDYYYMERARACGPVADASNSFLAELGIEEDDVRTFARQLNHFLAARSFDAGLELAQGLGLLGHPRLAQRLDAARRLERYPVLRRLLLMGISTSRLQREVARCARSLPAL
jgi:hypothetical protein